MVIDIQRTVIKTQLRRFLTLVLVAIIIIFLLLTGDRSELVMGMNKYSWALILGLVYVVFLVAESYLELNYIYFSDEGNYLILRYFSMSVVSRKKNSIEIPKEAFAGYEYHKSLWGFKKNIRLLQRFKKENARYPSVSLSGMNNKEIELLLRALDKYK